MTVALRMGIYILEATDEEELEHANDKANLDDKRAKIPFTRN